MQNPRRSYFSSLTAGGIDLNLHAKKVYIKNCVCAYSLKKVYGNVFCWGRRSIPLPSQPANVAGAIVTRVGQVRTEGQRTQAALIRPHLLLLGAIAEATAVHIKPVKKLLDV